MLGFYEERPDHALLLGDIVVGFQAIVAAMHSPGADGDADVLEIAVTRPSYFAVMTPCCSVGNKQIALAPLVKIKPSFLSTPYFVEDLTRINRPGNQLDMMPPKELERLSPEQRQAMAERGLSFGLADTFIYAEDDRLKKYDLKLPAKGASSTVQTGFYLLEFGSSFRVNCNQVMRNKPAPQGMKLLQLSVLVRQELRAKLSAYFARIPDEDRELLG